MSHPQTERRAVYPDAFPHQTSHHQAPELTRGSWTEVSPGARAQRQIQHAHAPPERDNPGPALDT